MVYLERTKYCARVGSTIFRIFKFPSRHIIFRAGTSISMRKHVNLAKHWHVPTHRGHHLRTKYCVCVSSSIFRFFKSASVNVIFRSRMCSFIPQHVIPAYRSQDHTYLGHVLRTKYLRCVANTNFRTFKFPSGNVCLELERAAPCDSS